jgi:hypothetical protein
MLDRLIRVFFLVEIVMNYYRAIFQGSQKGMEWAILMFTLNMIFWPVFKKEKAPTKK